MRFLKAEIPEKPFYWEVIDVLYEKLQQNSSKNTFVRIELIIKSNRLNYYHAEQFLHCFFISVFAHNLSLLPVNRDIKKK